MSEEEVIKCPICTGIVDTDTVECVEDLFCAKCSKPFPCMTHATSAHPGVDYASIKDCGVECTRCMKTFCETCAPRCDKCPPLYTDDSWDFCWDCSQKHNCSNRIFFNVMGDRAENNRDGWPAIPPIGCAK